MFSFMSVSFSVLVGLNFHDSSLGLDTSRNHVFKSSVSVFIVNCTKIFLSRIGVLS